MTSSQATTLDIGPIWCPLRLQEHPGAENFQSASEEFFSRHGLSAGHISDAKAMATGWLACMWAPGATPEGLQLLSDWLMWALLFDDQYCDSGPASRDPLQFVYIATRMMNRTLYPSTSFSANPVLHAFEATLQDIFRRVQDLGGGRAAVEAATAHFCWVAGAACGVTDRHGGNVRSLDDHLIARPMDGADLAIICMVQAANERWLDSATLKRDPAVRALTNAAGILSTLPTDIASYAHEHRQMSLESNVVAIIEREQRCSTLEAVNVSRHLVELMMQRFVDLKSMLVTRGDPGLNFYIDDLSNIVRGALEWQRLLPRYIAPLSATAGLIDRASTRPLHEICAERLFDDVLPIPPSIRWWWEIR